jgi:hypothetical protein
MRALAVMINRPTLAAFIIVWVCQNVAVTNRGEKGAISG